MVRWWTNNNPKPPIAMHGMPLPKNKIILRKGQAALAEYLKYEKPTGLTVQWPTAYGKTIGFALAWKHYSESGIANRMLLVVNGDNQRQQAVNDFAIDCGLVGADATGGVWVVDNAGFALAQCRKGKPLIYVVTVQKVEAAFRAGANEVLAMLNQPGTKWLVGFDEYHHFAKGRPWGIAGEEIKTKASAWIAMSATPHRRENETIFGGPQLVTTYQSATEERAIKELACHSYEYEITVKDGESVKQYKTSELLEQCDKSLDGVQAWEERRQIRYLPTFTNPLIQKPIERLLESRARTGLRLQMLVRAMTCLHAKMLAGQIKGMCGEMSVDWVGTGAAGRPPEENRRICESFCPPKSANGKRPQPTLDILVQVFMAGEGFDSVNVCEIVDLFPVSSEGESGLACLDKQFYGRAARWIDGGPTKATVNVPTDHHLHRYSGALLTTWMDAYGEPSMPTLAELDKRDVEVKLAPWPTEIPSVYRTAELVDIFEHFGLDDGAAKMLIDAIDRDLSVVYPKNPDYVHEQAETIVRATLAAMNKRESDQQYLQKSYAFLDDSVTRLAHLYSGSPRFLNYGTIGTLCKMINSDLIKITGMSRDEARRRDYDAQVNYLKSATAHIARKINEAAGI